MNLGRVLAIPVLWTALDAVLARISSGRSQKGSRFDPIQDRLSKCHFVFSVRCRHPRPSLCLEIDIAIGRLGILVAASVTIADFPASVMDRAF